jgi:hypothetical protein
MAPAAAIINAAEIDKRTLVILIRYSKAMFYYAGVKPMLNNISIRFEEQK